MRSLLEKIQTETTKLSSQERAFLADRLLSTLDREDISEIDAAWITEVEHRYEDYQAGNRPGIKAKDVFNDAKQILK